MFFLVLSLGLNIFLLNRVSPQHDRFSSAQADGTHLDKSPQHSRELEANRTNDQDPFFAKEHELLRLRNQVGQLRTQATQAAEETARLRTQLAEVGQNLVETQGELADAMKRSPEEWQQMLKDEQSARCANHLKQICMAARLWADDHDKVFPQDFISMKQYLHEPDVLFCPADTTAVRAIDWPELNPSSVSYRFLYPNGSEMDSTNVLVVCPIHGYFVLSDGSVHRR